MWLTWFRRTQSDTMFLSKTNTRNKCAPSTSSPLSFRRLHRRRKFLTNKIQLQTLDLELYQVSTRTSHSCAHSFIKIINDYSAFHAAPPPLPPTNLQMISSTLNSISIAWGTPSATTGIDSPLVLGYHVQYRGSGRASVEADIWKRASSFQVLSFEEVAREKSQPPVAITVSGLSSDTGYCFRIRARSAGGWGPFLRVSSEFRTLSCSSLRDQYSTVQKAILSGGAQGVIKLMKKHSEIRSVQQLCIEELAKIALRRKFSC